MPSRIPANDNALTVWVAPRINWVLEVDGFMFDSLSEAEAFSKRSGHTIYCRPPRGRKATTP